VIVIIKRRDSKQAEIEELTALLSLPLPENKRFLIDRELRFTRSGVKGEKDAAYLIDFYHATSPRWAVIHDLRLEHHDRVAQIDHLLINRFFDIYVLESKNFSYGVKITDTGEFLVDSGNKYFAIESPIEQNKRHQVVIDEVIKQFDIMPKRLGINIKPTYLCYVLVSPKSRVIRPPLKRFDTSMVIKADALRTIIDRKYDEASNLTILKAASKLVSFETVVEVAKRLVSCHKPKKMDYRKRFGIDKLDLPPRTMKADPKGTVPSCPKCGSRMILRTAKSGPKPGQQFWGCSNFPKCRYIVADGTARQKG
jgi:predicted RNA-binding Zn-ribbon protein involved in translation (DUF1610 family)